MLTAGDTPVVRALERMLAMRAYQREKNVDGRINHDVLKQVQITQAEVEEMYRVMAIANYEDRFVIPTTHRDVMRSACVADAASASVTTAPTASTTSACSAARRNARFRSRRRFEHARVELHPASEQEPAPSVGLAQLPGRLPARICPKCARSRAEPAIRAAALSCKR